MRLDVEGVGFGYGPRPVLEDVAFDAQEGDVIGILGENGCGKTTLLKCIDGLLRYREGRISVMDGERVAEVSDMTPAELARTMAVVSQNAGSTFPFTAMDVVTMGRYARSREDPRSRAEDEEAAMEALRLAGAEELASRSVMELSGGEFRRVMIARALCQDPSVLLLDEPTLHLDLGHQFELMELIGKLSSEKRMTVVMVTHDLVLAARYCNRIVMMRDGRVAASGRTENVLTEDRIRDVFGLEVRIGREDGIPGLNVVMIGRSIALRGLEC